MTRGKRTCKILKEIRQQIADNNEIEYITSECHFQGECKGTCPKCEEEVRYLENELNKRRQLGKVVTVAGISLGIAGSFSACNSPTQETVLETPTETSTEIQQDTMYELGEAPQDSIVDEKARCFSPSDIKIKGYFPFPNMDATEGLISTSVIEPPLKDGEMAPIMSKMATPTISTDTIEKIDEHYDMVGMVNETPAVFPEGEQALMKFLQDNVVYPKEAKEKGIEGRVYVRFSIEKDGSITDVSLARSVHKLLDEEALRVVKMMPKWKPGQIGGKNVKVQYNLPIVFSLDKDKK